MNQVEELRDKVDTALFNSIVAVGVREEGTVTDLDTLIIDRPKAIDTIMSLLEPYVEQVVKRGETVIIAGRSYVRTEHILDAFNPTKPKGTDNKKKFYFTGLTPDGFNKLSDDIKNKEKQMTDQQILEKAINKAIEGGWKDEERLVTWKDGYGLQKLKSTKRLREFDVEHIIFNHEFCKALWPNPPVVTAKDMDKLNEGKAIEAKPYPFKIEWWQYHIQQMVISPDPIAYIGEHM